jgi:hypothetical protein
MIPDKKISEEQLQELFDFMRRKRVRYYDLQVELVDHFASAIEDLWRKDPNLPFESAIQKVYGHFPITGFWSVIDQQTQAIQKEAWRWVFRTWISYFHWPKVLFSIAILLTVRLFFYLPIDPNLPFYGGFFLIVAGGFWAIYLSKKGKTKEGKRFLRLDATYGVIGTIVNAINSMFYVVMFNELDALPNWGAWLASFFFTYLGFFLYILFFQLPKRATEDLRRYFPNYV